MPILGIDPGLASTGYGVVASRAGRLLALDGGVIETPAGEALELRLAAIQSRLAELIAEHAPEAVAVESLYFGINVRSAFAVGQARGAALAAAGQHGLPCAAYTPQQVKAAVCGSGRAGKDQVAEMVRRLLGIGDPLSSDHAADALAVAICHANRVPLQAAVGAASPVPA